MSPFPDRLDRYVAREVLRASLLVAVVFVVLDWTFAFLDEIGDRRGDYGVAGVLRYVLMTTPRRLWEVVPYVSLLGALVGLSLLGARGELIVQRAAGRSLARIVAGALLPAAGLVLLGAALGEGIGPAAERRAQAGKALARDAGAAEVRGGSWHEADGLVTQALRIADDGTLLGVTQFRFDDAGGLVEVREASRAVPSTPGAVASDGPRRWRLEDVETLRLGADGTERVRAAAAIWISDVDPARLRDDALVAPARLSVAQLRSRLDRAARSEASDPAAHARLRLALWQKAGQPLSALVLVLVGAAFVFGPLREAGMGVRLVTGIGAGLAFRSVQDLLAPAALVFGFPPMIAVLAPVLGAALLGVLLLRRAA